MLVGYMRAPFDEDRVATTVQRDALLATGVDPRHLFEDRAFGPNDGRAGLDECLEFLSAGDTLVVWKLDRLGRSMPHLLQTIEALRQRQITFRSLIEKIDTGTVHGDLLFALFDALSQYERSITRERILAGVAASGRRDRRGGRPHAIDPGKMETILHALDQGMSKSDVCRTYDIARSTLYETLERIGWIRSRAKCRGQVG